MRFIRFQAVITDQDVLNAIEDRVESRRLSHTISMKSEEFNEKINNKAFFFVSDIDDVIALFGAIVDDENDDWVRSQFIQFMRTVKLSVSSVSSDEITLYTMSNLLARAMRSGFIDDDDEILESFNLDNLCGRMGREMDYDENLLPETSKANLYAEAKKYLSKESLIPELDRIFQTDVKAGMYGHPVHYFVEADDNGLRNAFYRILLQALKKNGRLQNKRYGYVSVHPSNRFSRALFNSLYNSCTGGAVVVQVRISGTNEDNYASGEREIIKNICEVMKKYRNKVLTIFCLPRECTQVKKMFQEELGNLCFIEIKEDFAKDDDDVYEYVWGFYPYDRPHESFGYATPAEYYNSY